MNMIWICADFYELNLVSLRYFITYYSQTFIKVFRKYNPAIFCRTHKMIHQNRYIMTLMFIFTHISKICVIFEAELRGTNPVEISVIEIGFIPFIVSFINSCTITLIENLTSKIARYYWTQMPYNGLNMVRLAFWNATFSSYD